MTSVLISGASIAGPALAFWLHKFGFDVTVIERASRLRPGGQAVDLRGVARAVAARMGLTEQIRAACTDTTGFSYVDKDNNRLSSMRAEQFGGDGQIAEIEILRGDLAKVLYDATKANVDYLFGDRIVAFDEQDDSVLVTFTGSAQRRFDVVIGADGLHSAVRAMVFGNEAEYVHHLGTYLAFWTMPNHLGLQNWALAYDEPHRSAGIRPIHGNREAMAYLAFQTGEIDYDHRDIERHKELVRELAAGMGWQVPEMIAGMADAADFYFDSCSQVRLDSWSRGRIGLLGDAAFCPSPLTGQGTNLAVVGAYVLAGELAAARSDHAAGLISYERHMRDWVSATQKAHQDGADSETWLKLVNAFDLPDYN